MLLKNLSLILVFSAMCIPAQAKPAKDFHCPDSCIYDASWCKDHLETCLENCTPEDLAYCSYKESKAMCDFCKNRLETGNRAAGICADLCDTD